MCPAVDDPIETLRKNPDCQNLFQHVIAQYLHAHAPRAETLPPVPAEKRVTWNFQHAAGSDGLIPLSRRDGERTISTVATGRISPQNIDALFSHEYAPGKRGAKGILLKTALQTDAEPTQRLFWRTGEGTHGIELHHRDAVSALRRGEAVIWEGFADYGQMAAMALSTFANAKGWEANDRAAELVQAGGLPGETVAQRLRREAQEIIDGKPTTSPGGKSAMAVLLTYHSNLMETNFDQPTTAADRVAQARETLAAPGTIEALAHWLALPKEARVGLREAARRQADRVLAEAADSERRMREQNDQADQRERVRRQDSYTVDDLLDGIGVQMTAEKNARGQLRVVRLDIDSSLTASQLSALEKHEGPLSTPEARTRLGNTLTELIAHAHDGIAPEVRGYRTINVLGLNRLRRAGIQIQAPAGFRLVDPNP